MGHVAIGVNHHQQSNGGDHHQHKGRQVIDGITHLQVKVSRRRPFKGVDIGRMTLHLTPEEEEGQHHGHTGQGDNQGSRWSSPLANGWAVGDQANPHRGCPQERQHRHEPSILVQEVD